MMIRYWNYEAGPVYLDDDEAVPVHVDDDKTVEDDDNTADYEGGAGQAGRICPWAPPSLHQNAPLHESITKNEIIYTY